MGPERRQLQTYSLQVPGLPTEAFNVTPVLWEGSTGFVFAGKSQRQPNGSVVALKYVPRLPRNRAHIPPAHVAHIQVCVAQAEQEVVMTHALACVELKIIDVFKTPDAYILMSEMATADMTRVASRLKYFPPSFRESAALKIAGDMVATVEPIHAARYSHRDLKCENWFVRKIPEAKRTGISRYKIVPGDFGIAQRDPFVYDLVGTPDCLPPEAFMMAKPADVRGREGLPLRNDALAADMYHIGVSLAEFLAARPFHIGIEEADLDALKSSDPWVRDQAYKHVMRKLNEWYHWQIAALPWRDPRMPGPINTGHRYFDAYFNDVRANGLRLYRLVTGCLKFAPQRRWTAAVAKAFLKNEGATMNDADHANANAILDTVDHGQSVEAHIAAL